METGILEKVADRKALNFEDLEVWQKAFSISLNIHRATLEFPKIEQYVLADQMRRASKSICANIAEGFSKQRSSKAEFRRFLQMALGSANEMLVWLKYAKELHYINEKQYEEWHLNYDSICRMLNVLHAKV